MSVDGHEPVCPVIERFHRQLEASLTARLSGPNWHDDLPIVMLGIRTSLKEDLKCSSAELVYGTTVRLPGQFVCHNETASVDVTLFLGRLREVMHKQHPVPIQHHGKRPSYVPLRTYVRTYEPKRRHVCFRPS